MTCVQSVHTKFWVCAPGMSPSDQFLSIMGYLKTFQLEMEGQIGKSAYVIGGGGGSLQAYTIR